MNTCELNAGEGNPASRPGGGEGRDTFSRFGGMGHTGLTYIISSP